MRQKRSFSVEQTDVNDLTSAYGGIPLKAVIRNYSETELTSALQSLFTHNNDSVLDLVDEAKNIGGQSKVLETMRMVRLQRQSMLSQFFTYFGDAYARQLLSNHTAGPSIEDYIYHDEIYSNLLQGDEVLEIRAAVDKMADNIKRRQWQVQASLAERFSKLAGHSYNVNNYPISAWTVCESFAKVVSGLQTRLSKKLIIMKMFEHSVVPMLERMYISINDIMIAGGVSRLDDVNRWGRELQTSESQNDIAAPVNSVLIKPGLANSDVSEHLNSVTRSELDYNVKRFVAMQKMLHPESVIPTSQSTTPSDVELSPIDQHYMLEEVVAGLSVLQEKILMLEHKEVIANNSNVRPHLLKMLQVMTNENIGFDIDRKSSDVIDIVSMMFDFILDDASLPIALRSIMIRLQIPIIKVAILDEEFFSSRLQSARQLLNEFAYSANVLHMLNQNGDPKEKSTYDQLEHIVEVILKDFTMDVGIFSAQLTLFKNFMRDVLKDRKIKTKKIQIAKNIVVKEIEQRLSNQVVPKIVAVFIKNIWNEVLTKVAIRTYGKGSIWSDILSVTDDLIWSAQPKLMEQERNLLVRMIPRLLNRLQDGLCLVKYSQPLIDQFFEHMEEIHLKSMRGLTDHLPGLPSHETHEAIVNCSRVDLRRVSDINGKSSVTYYAGETIIRENKTGERCQASVLATLGQTSTSLRTVTEMELGTWVEFSNNKRIVMGKLEWRCEFTGEFRFVDRNNTIVHSTNLENLVSLFDQSKAKLNDDIPLFDRAVEAVYVGLQVT